MQATKLHKVSYCDSNAEVRLECYADVIVIEPEGKRLYIAAIRLGGYPEPVKGMADAIYGGGSITVEVNENSYTCFSRVKQYNREYSHDGLYAEAVLRIKDEEQRKIDGTDKNESDAEATNGPAADAPRKCYIFCAHGDMAQLFEEVDKKTSVPLIPEFQNYVLSELQRRKILKPMRVFSDTEQLDAWVLDMSSSESNIISVVNDGLLNGHIEIPGAVDTHFPEVRGVTDYLNTFGIQIAARIKGQFNPLFDPATESLSQEVLAVNEYIIKSAGYSLFNAQLAASESIKRRLRIAKEALLIAECGTGKTKIGASALHAYQQRLHFRQNNLNDNVHSKHFNIVLCPSHMAEKWVREIEESLPNTFAVIVTCISDIDQVYAAYKNDNKTCYIILTKEKARDGYMRRPAATWNKHLRRFICPDCFGTLKMELTDDGSKYTVPADPFFFRKETRHNRKCEHCESMLWTTLVPEQQTEWVKVSDYGFVHRNFARIYLEYVAKKPKIYVAISDIIDNPTGYFANSGAYRRVSLSTYIKNKMRGKIDGLIIDELHNYNNNSGQGDAMGELFQVAKKVIGMTATLINGYSSGIFHLLYRVSPHLMLLDNKSYEKPIDFNDEYGVTECVYEIDAPDYNANRRTAKRKLRERQLPGVSPLVYSRFLLESAVFLSLNDMGKDLPEYEEIPLQLEMNEDVEYEYKRIEKQFIEILKNQKDIAKKVLSVYLNLLTVYPDQPYDHEPVRHPLTGNKLIVPMDTSSINDLHDKDRQVLDLVQKKVENGERVLIYTSWTRIDTQTKLTKLLTEQGYRVATLTATVSPKKREAWVEQQVASGVQVLITNPSLVETGLDLNDFTTILFYNISYNLFTLRQSSRRSWRINQRAPRIEVYFFYYNSTMQHRAIRLMASKLAVAGVIEGNLTDEGLAAMSDCQDMTTALARELTQGIEGEVEDLGAVFKRMAILKPVSDNIIDVTDKTIITNDANSINVQAKLSENAAQSAQADEKPNQQSPPKLLSLLNAPKPKRTPKKKASDVLENQMSLFDLLDVSA